MELLITVEIKTVYGNTTIYPVCEKAKLFAKYKGQKSLTNQDIIVIKELGYRVIVQPTIKEL